MARSSSAAVNTRVRALRTTVEEVTANLVELDADVTRQLLEASTGLTGKTAAAWADSSQRLIRLWQGQLSLQQVVTRIDALCAGRRVLSPRVLDAVCDVLDGPSVELPAATGRGRRLTSAAPATEGWTIEAALDSLSTDYEAVVDVVTAVGRVWGEAMDRMTTLATDLSEIECAARGLDLGMSNELSALRLALDAAERTARSDPLGFDGGAIEALSGRERRARHAVDEATRQRAAVRRDWDSLDRVLAEASALLEACGDGLGRLEAKVVVPASEWSALDGDRQELESLQAECGLARRSADARSPKSLRARVDAVLEDLRRRGAYAASGLGRRDELRGLLEAYRAKAQALGVEERADIDGRYGQLREMLYSAPCDLDAADALLSDFRRVVGQAGEGRR